MTDLRKAAEMLIKALDDGWVERGDNVAIALRQALAQEQNKCPRCGEVNPAEIHTCSPQVAQPEQDKLLVDLIQEQRAEIDRLRHALAQPEQEPVAWMVRDQVDGCRYPSALKNPAGSINGESQPLYTAPPSKQWVGLTDEELSGVYNEHYNEYVSDNVGIVDVFVIARAIEAALRSKNNG